MGPLAASVAILINPKIFSKNGMSYFPIFGTMINFDTTLYEDPVPAVVVDVFSKRLGEGLTAGISKSQLPEWKDAAQKRHEKGEHCPLVIGHTRDGAAEIDQPPKVGWITGPYSVNADDQIVGQHYIRKEVTVPLNGVPVKLSARELVDLFPRRSAELWFRDKKIDPVAMLGATTPEREMGLIRLAADSTPIIPHELPRLRLEKEEVADKLPDTDNAKFKQFEALMMQQQQQIDSLSQLLGELQVSMQSMNPQGGMGDDELEQLLNAHAGEQDDQQPPEKPVKNQLSAEAQELADVKLKLAKIETEKKLLAVEQAGVQFPFAKPEDREAFLSDLQAMPADMQDRMISVVKLSRALPTGSVHLSKAVGNANVVANGGKELTKQDVPVVMKLAREKGVEFSVAAKELGFVVV